MYAEVLDLFGDGSHEDDGTSDSFDELPLDDGKGSEHDDTLFEAEEGAAVGTEGKLEDEGFSAITTDFLLGICGCLKFPVSPRRTTFAAGGGRREGTGRVANEDEEGAAGAPAAAAARATCFAARLFLIFSVCLCARASRAICRKDFDGVVERVGTAAAPELDDDAVESIIGGEGDGAGREAGEDVAVEFDDGKRRRAKSDAAIAFEEDKVGRGTGGGTGSGGSGPNTTARSSSDGSTSIASGSSKRSATHGSTTSHFFTRRRISFPRK